MRFLRFQHCLPADEGESGFSLVEVVLAIGVVSFALLALVSLIPTGIKTSQQSVEESRAFDLLGGIVSDRMATPFGASSARYDLPVLTNSQTTALTNSFGVGDDFQKTAGLTQARYRIDYRLTPPPAGQQGPFFGWFRASWPALAPTQENSVEMVSTFPQP